MQTGQIDQSGTKFAYIDSGAPSSDTYTTLVCIHGHTYHAQNFSRLVSDAHKYNLRIIALNRRDYVGSTPFSQTELEAVNGENANAHVNFLRARGLEIARFLIYVISEKKIPRASPDGTAGGLALMGWSLGNVTAMAFLRHLNSYPSDVVDAIEPYLRTFFIYETGYSSLGYPSPEGAYHPLSDASIPERMRGIVFGTWVSSYYAHPVYATASPEDLPQNEDRNMSAFQILTPEKETARPCTLDTLKPDELTACVDAAPAARSEQPFWNSVSAETMYDQTCGTLLLDHQSNFKTDSDTEIGLTSLLPKIKVRNVYGFASVWSVQWGIWELEKDYKRWEAEGLKVRPLKFILVAGANHFLHWDDADLFLRTFAGGIRS
ncbi:hypothetical protein DFH11DRAFT_1671389 [Phellopilus nigrolimitatus]|nr:hypothetical protein DFH11DRAFT_1671389 [Phellopilus nigrolimitatus]